MPARVLLEWVRREFVGYPGIENPKVICFDGDSRRYDAYEVRQCGCLPLVERECDDNEEHDEVACPILTSM